MPKVKSKPSPFEKARSIENAYARDLRKIAREVGRIIDSYPAGDPASLPAMREALRKYADIIKPWADARATRMLAEVNRQDDRAWRIAAQKMSKGLREELNSFSHSAYGQLSTGALFRDLQRNQVELITSLPLQAADRVHRLTMQNLGTNARPADLKAEILRSGEVTVARATLIARTEVSRASANLTQARATFIGSSGYVWRTAKDSDVRPSHKKMEGKFVSWNNPPTLDNLTGHAGCLPNCRCYPEPIIPDAFD